MGFLFDDRDEWAIGVVYFVFEFRLGTLDVLC
jgi:hypothetical protein